MRKEWLLLVFAVCFEVGWVVGLKHATSVLEWGATVVAIVISFGMLIRATSKLPVGSAYAVFVGLGTVGTVILDIVLFGEPFRWSVLLLILLLLAGVAGLKLKTPDGDEGDDKEQVKEVVS